MLKTRKALELGWKALVMITIVMLLFGGIYLIQAMLTSSMNQESQAKTLARDDSQGDPNVASIDLGDVGDFPKWSKVEIALTGPNSMGMSNSPNPFELGVEVTFTGPGGQTFVVPAFYDGNGAGGLDGNVWKVRFSPNAVGSWSFVSSSGNPMLDGYTGVYDVTAPVGCQPYTPGGLPNFQCVGRLGTGGYYLKFADGGYWIKGGVDDPENFLGDAFGDWNAKKAAIDYLSSKGANSIYIITNNITPGDRNDTWPWVGETWSEAQANSSRFNVAKLLAWEDFFTYVQSKGIVLHLVLDDDSAWHNYDRDLYYREMIARFAHHPALIWNVGEEANENYSDSEQIAFAVQIRDMDPYDHPVTVHRKPVWPFLGNSDFHLTSIQPGDGAEDFTTVTLDDYNTIVIDHRALSASKGCPIPIMIDETPRVTLVNSTTQLKMRSQVLYPIYLAGGNYELHYYDIYGGGSVTPQDLQPMLDDMRRARQFIEMLPFWQMRPGNEFLSGGSKNYAFVKLGEIYAIYLPNGGSVNVDLSQAAGTLQVKWFNPQTGVFSNQTTTTGGGIRTFTAPFGGDAALQISAQTPVTSLDNDYKIYLPIIRNNC